MSESVELPLKLKQMRNKTKDDLLADLKTFKSELNQLRVSKVVGSTGSKLSKIRLIRKAIAQINTIYSKKVKSECKENLTNKKNLPYDLQPRMTRALRRLMTPRQAASLTLAQKKRIANNPRRIFILKN